MTPECERAARDLSYYMRKVLLAHIDGPVRIVVGGVRGDQAERWRAALIRRGLLAPVERGDRPRHTRLTEDGRWVLAALLADYADALAAVGLDGLVSIMPERPAWMRAAERIARPKVSREEEAAAR